MVLITMVTGEHMEGLDAQFISTLPSYHGGSRGSLPKVKMTATKYGSSLSTHTAHVFHNG